MRRSWATGTPVAFRATIHSSIRNFSGAMDEFTLFSRALGGDEIRSLHTQASHNQRCPSPHQMFQKTNKSMKPKIPILRAGIAAGGTALLGANKRTRERLETRLDQPARQRVPAGELGRPGQIPHRGARGTGMSAARSGTAATFTKGEDGAWTGYTRPLDEGFHYYMIKIDGAEVPDPNSMVFLRRQPLGQRRRNPRPRPGFLRAQERPARATARGLLPFEEHRTPNAAPLSTPRPVTTRIRNNDIPSSISSTATVRTNTAGACRVAPI